MKKFFIIFSILISTLMVACQGGEGTEEPKDPTPTPPVTNVDPNLNVALVKATESTITIGWTITQSNVPYISQIEPNPSADYTEDITKEYKVALYSNSACSQLVTSVQPVKENLVDAKLLYNSNTLPPRFTFTNLNPRTTYYVKVFNLTDGTSNQRPIRVATSVPSIGEATVVTSNAVVDDLILYQSFNGILYGGDMTTRGAALSRTDRASLTDYKEADCKGEITATNSGYYMVGCGTEIGLFSTLKGLLDEMGIEEWGWIGGKSGANGGSICARPGYVKIGTTANRAYIVTPQLKAIPEGKVASVDVFFKAVNYGSAESNTFDAAEGEVAIQALSEAFKGTDHSYTYSKVASEKKVSLNSESISDWKEYSVTLSDVTNTTAIAIGGALEATVTNRFMLDDVRIYVRSLKDAASVEIKGTVKYSDGTPAAGVAVSDGFTVVSTAADGTYKLTVNRDCWYIYYSVPADCKVETNTYGQPCFFTRYDKQKTTYDFTLTKLAGGKENAFTLFCLADPQCKDDRETDNKKRRHGDRFANESIPAIKAHAETKSVPCYGTTLGDVVYSEGSRNNEAFMDDMRDKMAISKSGMPIFQVMGNHDYTYFHTNKPINPDATSSTFNLKAQRAFETVFGPINYSWNRGDVHIIGMRTMQWSKNDTWDSYSAAFSNEQLAWLRQDLALVPKDKMVILCVHIPISNQKNSNIQAAITLLKQYKEFHIMSGHTHYARNIESSGVYEHVHGAVCGQWWWSNMNADGVPNGYGVYDIEGTTIKNWYYMGVNKGMNDRNYQMRLYRGDIKGGTPSKSFNTQLGHGVLLANVFNCDSKWVVQVYEDGTYTGNMTLISQKKYSADALGNYPCLVPTDSSQDWWSIGYHIGVVGRGKNSSYSNACYHMYKYTLKNPSCTNIRVEATDRFGTTYTCSEVTADYDYTLME